MKFRLSVVLLGVLAAACVQRPTPAPVAGWDGGESGARTIRVERGDTLFGIAYRYNEPARLIIAANRLTPPYRLDVGQTLVLPGPSAPMPEAPTYAAARPSQDRHQRPPAAAAERFAVKAAPAERSRIDSAEVPPPRRREPQVAETHRGPAADVRPAAIVVAPRQEAAPGDIGVRGFIWPVRGHVIEGYGAGRNHTQNDGINIAARAGAPVYAAASGEVVYVGNELRGYGNLVLIKHDGGYLTAYAHNAALLVHKGDRVTRGQVIAHVGRTGAVTEPQLHFEIRRGRTPVDPMQFLPPEQQASIGE